MMKFCIRKCPLLITLALLIVSTLFGVDTRLKRTGRPGRCLKYTFRDILVRELSSWESLTKQIRDFGIDINEVKFSADNEGVQGHEDLVSALDNVGYGSKCSGSISALGESSFACYEGEHVDMGKEDSKPPFMRSNRLSSGFQVELGQFPSYVRLLMRSKSNFGNCGGTLISQRAILTATHCLYLKGEPAEGGVAIMGITNLAQQATVVKLAKTCQISHFEVDPEGWIYNDVSLVILEKKVNYTNYIRPACLATQRNHKDNATCFAVGMGKTEYWDYDLTRLYALPVKRDCGGIQPWRLPSTSCYKGHDKKFAGAACSGDSGGPVICLNTCRNQKSQQFVVGGVSFGEKRCLPERSRWFASDYYKLGDKIEKMLYNCKVPRVKTTNTPVPVPQTPAPTLGA